MSATPEDVFAGRARWCVVEGDSADVTPTLPNDSVIVVADPPYDERTHGGYPTGNGHSRGGMDKVHKIAIPFAPIVPANIVPELLRISRGWVIAFCALEQFGAYQAASGESWVRAGLWHRPRAAPQFTGDRPAQAADGVAIMHSRRTRLAWNGGGSHAFWSIGHAPDEEGPQRGHTTRKPVLLMRELVRLFSDKDDVVFDGFAGIGTTGVAALAEGRRVILVEKDADAAEKARERCQAAIDGVAWRAPASQGRLFGGKAA